jgi:biopolymer transport protein ExbD
MRGHSRSQQEVELNMASMLDMAFQLLSFFILTFHPPPLEAQISLRLPPAKAVSNPTGKNEAGDQDKTPVDIKGVNTLTITVTAKRNGDIDFNNNSTGLGNQPVTSLAELKARLQAILKNPDSPFEQVIVQSSPGLRYGELMKVVDVCTQQKISDGSGGTKKLDKLSFEEMPK